MKKRILSFLMALLMVVSIIPFNIFAEGEPEPTPPEVEGTSEPTTEPVTDPPCDTCGKYECGSEHLNWCADCGMDDCGQNHCLTCGTIDCTKEHKACETCAVIDCTADHTNWCEICKYDNCGKDHNVTEPATEPVAPIDEGDEEETHPMVGKLVAISPSISVYYDTPGGTYYFIAVSYFADRMEIIAVDETTGTTYYQLNAAPGCPWKADSLGSVQLYDGIWVKADKTILLVYCEECKDYNCGIDHTTTNPSQPSEPEEPTVPSVSDTVTDSNGNEKTVTVTGEALPEGAELEIDESEVSGQLAEFGINADRMAFGLGISLVKDGAVCQPNGKVRVKVPVSADPGTPIGILHTHGGETTYMGLTEVQSDGTVEFTTDRFSTFAGFTVDFHYNEIDYSIAGLTSIKLSELFVALEIDRNAAHVIDVTYSDPSQIEVTQIDGDWQLESLKAFDTEETLEITFYDGEIITIKVTDATKIADYDYDSTKTYTLPEENDDYIVIWIDQDQLTATAKLQGHYTWNWSVDTADPNKNYASFSEDGKTATITVNQNAPVGYKYSLRNNNLTIKGRGRAIVRVIERVTFRYDENGIVTETTTFPQKGTGKKIGTWGIANTAEGSIDRTDDISISDTVPEAPGYEFTHWTYKDWNDSSATTKIYPGEKAILDESSITDGDYVDFFANWTKIPYKITYEENGGTAIEDQDYNVETNLTLRGAPTKEGYNFDGWKLSTKTGSWSATTYSAGQNMSNANYGNITLEAQWTLKKHKVTFVNEDGTELQNSEVAYGSMPSYTGSIPTKAADTQYSYTFKGWDKEIAAVTGDATYTATYTATPVSYTVTWVYGNGMENKVETVACGAAITKPTNPTRTGYNFTGWSPAVPATMPAANQTFTAQWTPNTYNLTFNYNGGKNSNNNSTADSGPYPAKTGSTDYYEVKWLNPAREGYVFDGWYDAQSGGTKVYYGANDKDANGNSLSGYCVPNGSAYWDANSRWKGTENLTLFAHWIPDEYTVTWVYGNGTENRVETVPYGAAITKPADPTRTGYSFTGWSPAVPGTMPAANQIFTAQWEGKKYTLTVYAKHGSPTTHKVYEVQYGKDFNNDLSREIEIPAGFGLKGLYTLQHGGGTRVYDANAKWLTGTDYWDDAGHWKYDGNLTVYADWESIEYTITYVDTLDNTTTTAKYTTYVHANHPAGPSHEGYNFVNWKVKETVGNWYAGDIHQAGAEFWGLHGNVTLETVWSPIEYTITYNLNGGTLAEGVTNPETYTIETTNFTLNNPTKPGYKFKGWATSADATTGTETVTIEKGTTGEKTFYALWERSLVDLTITATTSDRDQNFIFTVSGTRSDGVVFESIDVVLCNENGFQVTIKDMPVGQYTVTEKNNWSWRENAVGSQNADLRTSNQEVSFDFEAVNDLHWLSDYSYGKKGGS